MQKQRPMRPLNSECCCLFASHAMVGMQQHPLRQCLQSQQHLPNRLQLPLQESRQNGAVCCMKCLCAVFSCRRLWCSWLVGGSTLQDTLQCACNPPPWLTWHGYSSMQSLCWYYMLPPDGLWLAGSLLRPIHILYTCVHMHVEHLLPVPARTFLLAGSLLMPKRGLKMRHGCSSSHRCTS